MSVQTSYSYTSILQQAHFAWHANDTDLQFHGIQVAHEGERELDEYVSYDIWAH